MQGRKIISKYYYNLRPEQNRVLGEAANYVLGIAALVFVKYRIWSQFWLLLTKLRINQAEGPSLEEITAEVELVRKNRYEK